MSRGIFKSHASAKPWGSNDRTIVLHLPSAIPASQNRRDAPASPYGERRQYHAYMSSCCRAGVCREIFNDKFARRTLRRYRKRGLDPIERGMVESVAVAERNGGRVLEIGGGIGAIQAELIVAGADRGEVVELLSAYEPYAKAVARDNHIEDRTTFRVADLLEEPNAVAPADVVVLNRVVCCTSDGVRLTALASRLANSVVLLSYPRDRFVVRAVMKLMNAAMRVLGRSFRVFLHPTNALFAAARDEGFQTAETGRTFVWEYTTLRRGVPASG
jgi:hypothetical protein